jgi:TPR repeat protein
LLSFDSSRFLAASLSDAAKSPFHKPGLERVAEHEPDRGGSIDPERESASQGQNERVVVMARMEMNAIPASLAIPMEASAEAYYELGLMYAAGRQQPVDLVAAQKWFNVALAKGCDRAAAHRRELALEMSRDELALALREARSFLTRH